MPRAVVLCAVLLLSASLCANAQEPVKRPIVAVVLSGGAALGFAHIGVLKVIERVSIPVDIVVGTSMGAVVGGLYAAGYSPDDMGALAQTVDWVSIFNDIPPQSAYGYHERLLQVRHPLRFGFDERGIWAGRGLVAGQSAVTMLEMMTLPRLTTRDFDALPRRYRAVAADIVTGEQVVLGSGSIADAMRASISIPGVFAPFMLDGHLLVDGAMVNKLPVDVARDMGADIVIAVEVTEPGAKSGDELRNLVDVLNQTSKLMVEQNVAPRARLADLVIRPDLSGFSRMRFSEVGQIVDRGELAASQSMAKLQEIAGRIRATRELAPTEPHSGSLGGEPMTQTIAGIEVQGGGPDDAKLVERAFAPLTGRRVNEVTLRRSIDAVVETGRYDLVRIAFEGTDALTCIVRITPSTTARNELFFGADYQGSWSRTVSTAIAGDLGAGFEGPTGKGSLLLADLTIVDEPKAFIEYYQPVGSWLFLNPFFRYTTHFDSYLLDSTAKLALPYQAADWGVWAGASFGSFGELKAGYHFALARTFLQDQVTPVNLRIAGIQGVLRVDTRTSTAFPASGGFASFGYELASPVFGGTASYQKLGADAQVNIPLAPWLTLALSLSAGTDFSLSARDPSALPLFDAFALKGSFQFRGFEPWEVFGSHKAALGLDLRARIPALSRAFGRGVFLLASFDAGNVWQDPHLILNAFSLHYEGSVGLGVQIMRNLGVQLGVCLAESARIKAYLDLGSLMPPDFGAK